VEYTFDQLKDIIKNVPGYVVIYEFRDQSIVPIIYTESVPSFSGLTEDEYLALYGEDASEVVLTSDMPALAEKLEKLSAGEGDQEAIYRTYHKTKGFVWTHVFFKLLGTYEGNQIFLGNFADISSASVAPSLLLDNSHQKVYVIERDTYDLLYANSAAIADKSDVPKHGQTCYQYIRKMDSPCPNCVVNQISGEKTLETLWNDTTRDKSYGIKAVPMKFFDKPAYAFFIEDMTEHVDLEGRLKQEQEKYRAATEGANLRVYEYDIKTHTIILPEHARKLFGVPSKIINNVPDSLMPEFREEDHQRLRDFFARVNSGEKIVEATFHMSEIHGNAPYLHFNFTAVFDKDGVPEKAYAVAEDVTAQKIAEEDFNITIQNLLSANPNALCSYKLNLTRNLCSEEHGTSEYILNMLHANTADKLFENLMSIIPTKEQRDTARIFFDRESLLGNFAAGTKTMQLDYQRKNARGAVTWVRTFVNMLKNPETEEVMGIFYSVDITDEKRRNEIFNIVTDQEYDFVALLYPDISKIEFFNLSSKLLKKYHEVLGRPGMLYDFDSTRRFAADGWISEEDREYYLENSSISAVTRELDKNGHSEISLRGHYTGHPDEYMCRKLQHYYLDEQKDTILIIQSDVTATYLQQQNETDRAKAEAKHIEDIIDSVPTGICVFRMPDADHLEGEFVNLQMFRIIGLNPPDSEDARQRMLSDPMVSEYMKDAFTAVHPDDKERVRRSFHDGYEQSHFSGGSYRLLKKDGSTVWVNQNAVLREVRPDCRVFYAAYRVVDREVELQGLLEQQLEKEKLLRKQANAANTAKSDFLSRMSHDIRTPLNGIIGMTYLTQEMDLPEKAKENLVKIDTSSRFLLSLINDVLDMSKAESGKIELHLEPYPVDEFANYVDSIIEPLCEERNQTFTFEPVEMLDNVVPLMDKLRINQVVFNLLSNAVKYTPEGGSIKYRVAEKKLDEGHMSMHIDVVDNGIGMSREFQSVLFDPFTQENRQDIDEMRGSGLGLAITKKMVDAMDGDITVESELGKGTTFHIDLTLDCIPEDIEIKTDESDDDMKESLDGRHVLLCEDHPLNQEIASAILREQNALVTVADDGEAGVRTFIDSAIGYFDCILMDIHMPIMNGYEATMKIRSLKRPDAKTIPIIAMTADAFTDDIEECLAAGMNGHIAKPIDPNGLCSKLCEMMRVK